MSIWPFRRRQRMTMGEVSACSPVNAACSFCHRPQKHVGPMVQGPNNVFICVDCVRLAYRVAEVNSQRSSGADIHDPSVNWSGHMHLLCYFNLAQIKDDEWTATAFAPNGFTGSGSSPKDAIKDLQSKILAATAKSLSESASVGSHFTNHVDVTFR